MIFTNSILRSFCTGNERRPITCRPWSVGEYSYATDGTIIVRVRRLDDVPPPDDPKIEKTAARIDEWIGKLASAALAPVPRVEIPAGKSWRCDKCDGRGTEHDCPDCLCECDDCDGSGSCHQPVMVAWRGTHICRSKWRLIAALPDSKIAASPPLPPIYDHVAFAFDGGVGIVMPMRRPTLPEDVEPLVINAEMAEA